jgi:hypothetical protein
LIEALIEDAARGQGTAESAAFAAAAFDGDVEAAILAAPDASRFLLLMLLLRDAPDRAAGLPATARATILAGALATLTFLNDFGTLGDDAWDGPAAQALLAAGPPAAPTLRPLLDDVRPAPLFGSETATVSDRERYRRCDFAYRYLRLVRGERPEWNPDPAARDRHLAQARATIVP